MAAPSLTNIYAGLIVALESSAAWTTIFGSRLYRRWPAGDVVEPVAVLWETSSDNQQFDQGGSIARDMAIALELAGPKPDPLANGEVAAIDVTNTVVISATGFRSVWARVASSRPDFNPKTQLHRRVLTMRVIAQPA